MTEKVEEDLLATHVASNGSHESTDPNCSFRLQDPHGIQGLEGRFRVQIAGSMHARPASTATTTMRTSSARAETTVTR